MYEEDMYRNSTCIQKQLGIVRYRLLKKKLHEMHIMNVYFIIPFILFDCENNILKKIRRLN